MNLAISPLVTGVSGLNVPSGNPLITPYPLSTIIPHPYPCSTLNGSPFGSTKKAHLSHLAHLAHFPHQNMI